MEFNWDAKKAKANIEKHKISFEEAMTVFYDPLAKVAHDPDHSEDEDRFILIGYSQKSRLLFVVHAHKDSSQAIRIISARKASRSEQRDFEEL